MIAITDRESLFQTLLSIDETGYFVTPIKVFLQDATVTVAKVLYYTSIIDSDIYVVFELTKNIITKKFFYRETIKGMHREQDEPAFIKYSIHGNILLKEWFINGSPKRKNNLTPISVIYNYTKKNVKKVKNNEDELCNKGFIIFNYITKSVGLSCSYILYDSSQSKIVDICLCNNNQPLSLNDLVIYHPSIKDISLAECFDLSTCNVITLLDMIYQ